MKEPDNLRALLIGQEGSVIDVYGGEWEFDQYTAILHKARGADNGVTIRYGKNLTDLKQEENIESTYTGICPYWKGQQTDGTDTIITLPEKVVVHSTFGANFPYQRTKIVDMSSSFQAQPTVAELRAKAQNYIESNDVGTPKVSLDIRRNSDGDGQRLGRASARQQRLSEMALREQWCNSLNSRNNPSTPRYRSKVGVIETREDRSGVVRPLKEEPVPPVSSCRSRK